MQRPSVSLVEPHFTSHEQQQASRVSAAWTLDPLADKELSGSRDCSKRRRRLGIQTTQFRQTAVTVASARQVCRQFKYLARRRRIRIRTRRRDERRDAICFAARRCVRRLFESVALAPASPSTARHASGDNTHTGFSNEAHHLADEFDPLLPDVPRISARWILLAGRH